MTLLTETGRKVYKLIHLVGGVKLFFQYSCCSIATCEVHIKWVSPIAWIFEFRNAIIINDNSCRQYRSRMVFCKLCDAIVTVSHRFLNPSIQRRYRSSFLHGSADGVVNSS